MTLEEIVAAGPPHGTNWSYTEPLPCECELCEEWKKLKDELEAHDRPLPELR